MSNRVATAVPIGVGIDTARYGHQATFLREDKQPAAPELAFSESQEGYEKLKDVLTKLAERYGGDVDFFVRVDAAGQYASNLMAFLPTLPFQMTISTGEPKRNKDYAKAHYPKGKSDKIDSKACARFAVVERPEAAPVTPPEFAVLRDLAGALQSQRRQTTRRVNQLHNHLARAFPELALLAQDFSADWVLKLLEKYPTAERIAAARTLTQIRRVDQQRAEALQDAARRSVGSLKGPVAEQFVRQLVRQVRQSQQAEQDLEKLLKQAFEALPEGGHRQLLSIPGIGWRTAAALTAKIVSIDRFATPERLVSYFGVFPEENTSGVDKFGRPVPVGTLQMSQKGNDLVRALLWMACQTAIQHNPPIRALYARQKAAGKRGDVALGHCLRKMLHLVFAIWKTNCPFDPQRHAQLVGREAEVVLEQMAPQSAAMEQAPNEAAAGRTGQSPKRIAVTADGTHLATRNIRHNGKSAKRLPTTVAEDSIPRAEPTQRINFAELRKQISMTEVLHHLGLLDELRGNGPQRRGPCPVHDGQSQNARTFSVNLEKHVFRCLDPHCDAHGNVLDLWAAVHNLSLRDAALHLAATFNLDPSCA